MMRISLNLSLLAVVISYFAFASVAYAESDADYLERMNALDLSGQTGVGLFPIQML